MHCMIGLPRECEAEGATDGVHGERHQSDTDAAAVVCEHRTCVRARYRTIYGRHDIVRLTNSQSISRYRVIDIITIVVVGLSKTWVASAVDASRVGRAVL